MGIEDIQISEELETNAPSIKYSGNEGPKSPQQMQEMMVAQLEEEYSKYLDDMMEQGLDPMSFEEFLQQALTEGDMAGGNPLPNDPTKPVNPFAPKPTGPTLPNRQMAAYGGIMGLDGRKQYGIGSWFQENIMDPIKGSKLGKAATVAAATYLGNKYLPKKYGGGKLDDFFKVIGDTVSTGTEKVTDLLGKKVDKDDPDSKTYGGTILSAIGKNIIPIAGGLTAGLFTKNSESNTPGLPNDNTALQLADLKKSANLLDQKQGLAAGLNFLPTVASRKYSPEEMAVTYANAANGGRIGYQNAGPVLDEQTTQMILDMHGRGMDIDTIQTITQQDPNSINAIINSQNLPRQMPREMAEGGIMDLGGMEKDYRAEGGFVPIGREEKADDVPARLSVNEFVFTADAVRNAGSGDIDQGAKVMENMMKHLEAGGQVSEESQGLGGAREMFATSERLSEVI